MLHALTPSLSREGAGEGVRVRCGATVEATTGVTVANRPTKVLW